MIRIIVLAAALSAGNAEFDSTAASGALDIVVSREAARLAAEGPAQGALEAKMLAAPRDYATVAQAKARARVDFDELSLAELKAAREKAAARLGIGGDGLADLERVSGGDASATFERRFAAERKAACEAQAKGLVTATRPTEAEFEEKPEDVLRREMTARIASEQKVPVFEENLPYISEKIVDPVLASARAERQRQTEYMMRARSDAVAPSKLAADLKARLEANLAARAKSEEASKVWGAFPSVLSTALPAAVERRTVDRLVGQVENVKLEVTVDDVLKAIEADPAAHGKASESEGRFALAYSSQALANALEKAVAEAPAADREELRGFLSKNLTGEAPAKAVERLVRRDVMPRWREARVQAAAAFAGKTWPTLKDGTWFPSAELADDMAARSDYADAVKGWRGVAGLEELANAAKGAPVMEEAADEADRGVAAAFDRARNAVAAQSAIVDAVHPDVLKASRALKESFFRRTPDLKAVTEMLTEATRTRWGERRAAVLWPDGERPANADEQHVELFPSVRRKIELVAKSILEEMQEPPPEEPPEPEEETDAEAESDEEPELEYSISVSRKGGRVEVKLLQGKSPLFERSTDEKLAPFEQAMREVSGKLGGEILKLR